MSRRAFGLLVAATAGTAGAAAGIVRDAVTDREVVVKTPDGSCDAVLFYPTAKGRWPTVLIWPEIMGLRPVFREMGRRLAGEGYVVLVPNPFYRSKHAPVIEGAFDFNDPAQRSQLFG